MYFITHKNIKVAKCYLMQFGAADCASKLCGVGSESDSDSDRDWSSPYMLLSCSYKDKFSDSKKVLC